MDKCRKCIDQLKATLALSGSEDKTVLLEAAIFLKDKNPDQAFEHLKVCFFNSLLYLKLLTSGFFSVYKKTDFATMYICFIIIATVKSAFFF